MQPTVQLGRRGFLSGALGAAGALLLAGCSSGQGSINFSDWPTEPDDKPARITWWSASIPDDSGGDLRGALVAAFQKRYPHISVNVVSAPSDTDTNRTTLTTQIAAGSPTPDVVLGDIAWPGQFAMNKLAAPLKSLVPTDFWEQFAPGLRKAAQVGGEYYMFPAYIDEAFLVYRKDLLAKHSLQVPNSWEELESTSKKLIEAGDVQTGFVWQGSVYEGLTCNIVEFLADAGATLTDTGVTRPLVTSSDAERAFAFMRKLITDGVSPKAALTYIEQSSLDAFTTGRAAFHRNWSYAYDTANSGSTSKVAGKVGIRSRPGFDGGTSGNSTIGGWGNYINPHTANPAAAVTFGKWMAGEEGQQLIVAKGGVIPARTASLTSPAAIKKNRPQYRIAKNITLVPRPTASGYYPKLSQAVYVNANSLIAGQESVAGGVSQMSSQMTTALKGEAL